MRTYRLTIAYDGTRYQGWQRQSSTGNTIQGVLEEALFRETGLWTEVNGSGRTDAGVHAKGQTASIVLPGKIREQELVQKLNERLPADIRILNACLVRNGFHARKSAVGKVYEYHIDTGEKPDVFTRRFCCHFPRRTDLERMREAAGYLTGTHDFSGYTDKKDAVSSRRTIYDIMISGQDHRIVIEYDGTGFLYHMVRILTGTLLEAGAGIRRPEEAAAALRTGDRRQAGFLAPAKGLFLKEVRYD